ncbi:MAG: YsnF/AvaK domain-containing protein [Vulcanimicrobiaceae bacterium]
MFNDYETAPHESALAATFPSREAAHEAVKRLHDEGFHKTWIGLTKPMTDDGYGTAGTAAEPRIEEENALARFFGGGNESLHEALRRHGVSDADASRVDTALPANSAILTVDGSNHPELATEIISTCGGSLLSSNASSRMTGAYDEEVTRPKRGKPFAEFGNYSAGKELPEEKRLQLREERLSVDKRRVASGEAVVGKRVVSETSEVDVPLVHEELYIERRPASGTYGGNVGTIGDGETIHVPLSREELKVTKNTVVTEEVAVGQREVSETKHVSETLRKEELDVDRDVATGRTSERPLRDVNATDRL